MKTNVLNYVNADEVSAEKSGEVTVFRGIPLILSLMYLNAW